MGLLDRLRRQRRPAEPPPVRLVAAADIVARYRRAGGDVGDAVAAVLDQLRGLQAEIENDKGWQRLLDLMDQAGDPWNADDWPLGFDSLLCCLPLCTHVDYECVRCPLGQQQGARSCSNPETGIGKINEHITFARREALRAHLVDLVAEVGALKG